MKAFYHTQHDYGMLVLRVSAALAMLPFGLLKVGLLQIPDMPGGIDTTIQMMSQGGIPVAITVLVMTAETLGALSLLAGFCTRFCAASLGVIMIGATWMVFGMGVLLRVCDSIVVSCYVYSPHDQWGRCMVCG